MIVFKHVEMTYPNGHQALRDVDFALDGGELAFLTGTSGAGKTTILKLISGIERATGGDVAVGGVNPSALRRRELPFYRRQIGMVFQDHRLLPDRNVFDNVALPLVVSNHDPADTRRKVRGVLAMVGLAGSEQRMPAELSSGEQQRVGIARAAVHQPAVVVADEPTGNLDPGLSKEIFELFLRLNDLGTTVLIATHDIELISIFSVPALHLTDGVLRQ
jgi:cell division transport system ATP-binding protein